MVKKYLSNSVTRPVTFLITIECPRTLLKFKKKEKEKKLMKENN